MGVFLGIRAVQAMRSRAKVRKQVGSLPSEILRMMFRPMSNQDLGKVMLVCKRLREVGEPLQSCRAVEARRIRALSSALPTEILRMIFRTMSNKDLGKVMLVCKRWREVGEPQWSWPLEHILSVGRRDLNMLGINRVRHADEITVENDGWENEELEELIHSVGKLEVVFLNMPGIDLTSLDPYLLAEIVTNKMDQVDLSHCKLTDHQLNTIFREIDERFELHVKISGVNLSNVDQDILAVGVNRLETAEMYKTQLTQQQMTSILTKAGRETKLVEVCLDSNTIERDPFLIPSIGPFGSLSVNQLVDQEIVQQAKLNIRSWYTRYDFDHNSNWTSYSAGNRIIAYVANQSLNP